MPPTDPHLPPRYREPRLLARGGMADVYQATDEELSRDVAVKVLAARYAEDESLRRRFSHEALTAARLSGNLGGLVTDVAGKPQMGAAVVLFNRQARPIQRELQLVAWGRRLQQHVGGLLARDRLQVHKDFSLAARLLAHNMDPVRLGIPQRPTGHRHRARDRR